LSAMCADATLSAAQKKVCQECLPLASGNTYDERVKQMQTCFAEKSGVVPQTDPLVLCEDSSFSATEKAKCISCVKAADTTQWNAGATAQNAIIAKIGACWNAVPAGPTDPATDICNDPSPDADTRAFCKACQLLVADPQDATMLGTCIAEKRAGGEAPPVMGKTTPCDDPRAQLTDDEYVACISCYNEGMSVPDLQDCMIERMAVTTGTVPVCDAQDPGYNLKICLGKICDPTDVLYNLEACDYAMRTAEQPYYATPGAGVDTMDPCDTSSQMFDATTCTDLGSEVYTSEPLAETGMSPLIPIALIGGAAALVFMGMRGK